MVGQRVRGGVPLRRVVSEGGDLSDADDLENIAILRRLNFEADSATMPEGLNSPSRVKAPRGFRPPKSPDTTPVAPPPSASQPPSSFNTARRHSASCPQGLAGLGLGPVQEDAELELPPLAVQPPSMREPAAMGIFPLDCVSTSPPSDRGPRSGLRPPSRTASESSMDSTSSPTSARGDSGSVRTHKPVWLR